MHEYHSNTDIIQYVVHIGLYQQEAVRVYISLSQSILV